MPDSRDLTVHRKLSLMMEVDQDTNACLHMARLCGYVPVPAMSPELLTALVNKCGAGVHGHGWETSEDSQSHNPTKKLHPSAYCSLWHQHWVTVPFLDHYHLTSFPSGVRNTYCVVPRMVAGGARDTCLYCSLVVAVSRIPGKKAEGHVNLKWRWQNRAHVVSTPLITPNLSGCPLPKTRGGFRSPDVVSLEFCIQRNPKRPTFQHTADFP